MRLTSKRGYMKTVKEITIPLFLSIGFIAMFCSMSTHNTTNWATIPSFTSHSTSPRPNLLSLPKTCRIKRLSSDPYIVCIYDFLTDTEVEHLKTIGQPLLTRSMVVGEETGSAINAHRTSSSAFLNNVESEITKNIQKRAAKLVRANHQDVEALQVVHYKDGQKYEPHYDFFDRSKEGGKTSIGQQGQRMATLLVYLNDIDDDAGGQTFFPKVLNGLKINPKKNMAVFWYNVLPNGKEDERTLHGGLPINKGEKWAVNIWIRDPKIL